MVAQGESIPVNNPPAPIQTEAKAKDVRFLLEALHGQITRAAQDGFLPPNEAKRWIREVRHILVLLHIEFFNNLGQHALQQNQPGQARLAFERGVQYLRKQQEPQVYAEQLEYLEKLLARANAQVMDKIAPVEGEVNQLTEGLKDVEADADWKKKSDLRLIMQMLKSHRVRWLFALGLMGECVQPQDQKIAACGSSYGVYARLCRSWRSLRSLLLLFSPTT